MAKGNIIILVVAIALVMVGLNAGNVQDTLFGNNEEIYYDFNQLDLLNQSGLEVITNNSKVYNSLKISSGMNNKTFTVVGDFGNLTAKELEEYSIEMKTTMLKGDNTTAYVVLDFDPVNDINNLTNYNSINSVNYYVGALQPTSSLYSTNFEIRESSNSYANVDNFVREYSPKKLGAISGTLNIKFNNVAKYNIFRSEVDLLNTTKVDKTRTDFQYYSDEYFDTSDTNTVLPNAKFILSIEGHNNNFPINFGANDSMTIDYIKLVKG